MTSPRIDQIQTALASTLGRIPGVVTYAYRPKLPNYAQGLIIVGDYSSTRDTFSPQYTYLFDLEVYAVETPPDYGQIFLSQMMSPVGSNSIERALLADPTLGGVVDDVAIEPFIFTVTHAAMTDVAINGIEFLRIIRPIEVYA